MQYFVPLTVDKNTWDLTSEMIFLDKLYEFQLSESEKKSLSYKTLSSSTPCSSQQEINNFCEELIKNIFPFLNSMHKVNFPYNYWHKMLWHQINHYLYFVVSKVELLQHLKNNFKNDTFYTTINENSFNIDWLYKPERMGGDEKFQHYLFVRIAEDFFDFKINYLSNSSDITSDIETQVQDHLMPMRGGYRSIVKFAEKVFYKLKHFTVKKLFRFIKRNILNIVNKTKEAYYKKNANVLCYTIYFTQNNVFEKIKEKSKNKIQWLDIQKPEVLKVVDVDSRNALREFLSSEYDVLWKKVSTALLSEFIPMFYIENFKPYLKASKKYLKKHPHLKVCYTSAIGMMCFPHFFMIYAQMKKNIIIADMQHGGNYGIGDYVYNPDCSVLDCFFAWGKWVYDVSDTSCLMKLCPSHKLANCYDGQEQRKDYILYVGSYLEPYPNYYSYERGLSSNIKYIERQIEFFNALSQNVISQMLLREVYVDFGYHIDDIIARHFPKLKIQNFKQENYTTKLDINSRNFSFANTLLNCSLCIYDDIESPFTEALYCNKPVILLLDKKRYKLREEEKTYFKAMYEAKLLFYEPKDLASLLNKINNKIDDWWNEKERQKVVKLIQNRYVSHNENLNEWWADELINLCHLHDK